MATYIAMWGILISHIIGGSNVVGIWKFHFARKAE